jgi:peptide/nickel transport system ATP-binding protein
MADASDIILQVEDAACWFDVSPPWLSRVIERRPRRLLKAVDGVSFAVRRGTTFSIVGESGCGKSTLARLVVGLIRPTHGTLAFGAIAETASGAPRVQMIFQDPYASLNPRWRVADIVAEPLLALAPDMARSEVGSRVAMLLAQVGLAAADGGKYPHQFSGGQRQRISIARALAAEPRFLVCDEPTSALDVSVQAQVLNLMRDLQRRMGLTYLFISHNLAVVHHIADRVGVMYLGRIVELAPTKRLFEAPQHPYTRMLLAAVPDLAMTGKPRSAVAGEVPNPLDPPPGCAFHPRCPFATQRCRRETPVLRTVARGGEAACHAVEEGRLTEELVVAASGGARSAATG